VAVYILGVHRSTNQISKNMSPLIWMQCSFQIESGCHCWYEYDVVFRSKVVTFWKVYCCNQHCVLFHLMLCVFAAFLSGEVPIFLPFTTMWKIEIFCAELLVWVSHYLCSSSESYRCHYWNNGMEVAAFFFLFKYYVWLNS
jgi:hypothetical protein